MEAAYTDAMGRAGPDFTNLGAGKASSKEIYELFLIFKLQVSLEGSHLLQDFIHGQLQLVQLPILPFLVVLQIVRAIFFSIPCT